MAKQVPIGAKGTAEERVQYDHTLTARHHSLPPILATAEMIRLMNTAGRYALQPFCEEGEISVSTEIQVVHRIPVGMNAAVRATAEVEAIEDSSYRLRVTAYEGKNEIGGGTMTRTIVRTTDYLKEHEIPLP